MVFYGLAILSGTILMNLFFKRKEDRGRGFFLFITVLLVFFGVLQRSSFPIEVQFLRLLTQLIKISLNLAPYVLALFSVGVILRSYLRLKKRRWSRKYAVLFSTGIFLLILLFLILANHLWIKNQMVYTLEFMLGVFFLYVLITFLGFVFLAFLYRLIRPDLEKDYIIILGSGLLPNGKISLLLKYRLDEALLFHHKQKKRGIPLSCIIVSGGKSTDESISEATVMKDYLVEKGILEKQIIMEDQSVNTHQNFLYSRDIIGNLTEHTKIVFITNNFHVLRSGVYARRASVHAEGIGAKTPFHYLPYALIREYLALMFIYRTYYFYILIIFLGFSLMLYR
ncbi:YdcF family protein [Jeotgalibaca sp. MA1X17-3]|uniref:YdcF family protein n=1 Tax=Jeotgalibaca sp. MA1X17-3 TaxID=2908211 RepID=UPI001F3F9369|nr:YdcF family protein [Jeotgalibaca sp. MA1X17-3]UJF15886.1 YdcF family protein [Jeotgalibaca sp. MA1X17-3]